MKRNTALLILLLTLTMSFGQVKNPIDYLSKANKCTASKKKYKSSSDSPSIKLDSIRSDYNISRYIYNQLGSLLIKEYEIFDNHPYQDPTKIRSVYTYTANGNRESETVYTQNMNTGLWNPYSKTDISYNEDERVEFASIWDLNNEKWKVNHKSVYSLNSFNLVEKVTTYFPDDDGITWVETGSVLYQYNSSNQLISTTESKTLGQITTYTYTNGLLTEVFEDNQGSQDWKFNYYYDANNDLTYTTTWYEYDGSFYEAVKVVYNTNTNTLSSEIVLPDSDAFFDETLNYQVTSMEFYDFIDDQYKLFTTHTVYYSSTATTTLVSKFNSANILVYPNPTIDKINISLGNYKKALIYNSVGNIVSTISLGNESSINVETLNDGIYILELVKSNNEVVRGNFIKK